MKVNASKLKERIKCMFLNSESEREKESKINNLHFLLEWNKTAPIK